MILEIRKSLFTITIMSAEQAATLRPQVCREQCGLLLDAAGDTCWSCKFGVYVQFAKQTDSNAESERDASSVKSISHRGENESVRPGAGTSTKVANLMPAQVPWRPVVYTLLLESEPDDDDDDDGGDISAAEPLSD